MKIKILLALLSFGLFSNVAGLLLTQDQANTLGITDWNSKTDYTDAAIKKAYRKQIVKYHPDKNKGNEEAARERYEAVDKLYKALTVKEDKKLTPTEAKAKATDIVTKINNSLDLDDIITNLTELKALNIDFPDTDGIPDADTINLDSITDALLQSAGSDFSKVQEIVSKINITSGMKLSTENLITIMENLSGEDFVTLITSNSEVSTAIKSNANALVQHGIETGNRALTLETIHSMDPSTLKANLKAKNPPYDTKSLVDDAKLTLDDFSTLADYMSFTPTSKATFIRGKAGYMLKKANTVDEVTNILNKVTEINGNIEALLNKKPTGSDATNLESILRNFDNDELTQLYDNVPGLSDQVVANAADLINRSKELNDPALGREVIQTYAADAHTTGSTDFADLLKAGTPPFDSETLVDLGLNIETLKITATMAGMTDAEITTFVNKAANNILSNAIGSPSNVIDALTQLKNALGEDNLEAFLDLVPEGETKTNGEYLLDNLDAATLESLNELSPRFNPTSISIKQALNEPIATRAESFESLVNKMTSLPKGSTEITTFKNDLFTSDSLARIMEMDTANIQSIFINKLGLDGNGIMNQVMQIDSLDIDTIVNAYKLAVKVSPSQKTALSNIIDSPQFESALTDKFSTDDIVNIRKETIGSTDSPAQGLAKITHDATVTLKADELTFPEGYDATAMATKLEQLIKENKANSIALDELSPVGKVRTFINDNFKDSSTGGEFELDDNTYKYEPPTDDNPDGTIELMDEIA